MDNGVWKKEYEKASSDKLRLFGVDVLAEFENGARLVACNGSYRLINSEYTSKLVQDGLVNVYRHPLMGLYEINSNDKVTIGAGYKLKSYRALLFDDYGNVLSDNLNSLSERCNSRGDLYEDKSKYIIDGLDRIIEYLPKRYEYLDRKTSVWNTTLSLLGNRGISVDSYMKTRKCNKYLVVSLGYDVVFCGVVVYDTYKEEVVLKSNHAKIEEIVVALDGGRAELITAIATEKEVFICTTFDDKVHKFHEETISISDIFENSDTLAEFLERWYDNRIAINNKIFDFLETVTDLYGYKKVY